MLVAFWQVQRLTREINSLEKRMMDKQTELSHFQKYASVLGGTTTMTLGNIAGLSAGLLPRATLFSQYSDQVSSMTAMQNLQTMKMMGRVPYTGNIATQQQLEMSAFNQFKQESMKALKQQEASLLNEKEKEMQLEMNQMEQRLKMMNKQLETYKQLADKQVEKMVPNFG